MLSQNTTDSTIAVKSYHEHGRDLSVKSVKRQFLLFKNTKTSEIPSKYSINLDGSNFRTTSACTN